MKPRCGKHHDEHRNLAPFSLLWQSQLLPFNQQSLIILINQPLLLLRSLLSLSLIHCRARFNYIGTGRQKCSHLYVAGLRTGWLRGIRIHSLVQEAEIT